MLVSLSGVAMRDTRQQGVAIIVTGQKGRAGMQRHRAGDGISLRFIAAELGQKGMFLSGFNTFCKGRDAKPFGQRRQGEDHSPLAGADVASGDKAEIDLQPVNVVLADHVKAGIAGAEINQIQLTSCVHQL